jgi:hypothetical protein
MHFSSKNWSYSQLNRGKRIGVGRHCATFLCREHPCTTSRGVWSLHASPRPEATPSKAAHGPSGFKARTRRRLHTSTPPDPGGAVRRPPSSVPRARSPPPSSTHGLQLEEESRLFKPTRRPLAHTQALPSSRAPPSHHVRRPGGLLFSLVPLAAWPFQDLL